MRGFTLVEILVVVGVSVVVLGSFIAYNSASRSQIALTVEQAKIAQLILRAKSLAVSSYSLNLALRCGYGVSINYSARSYSLNRYDVSTNADCDAIYNGGGSVGFEKISAVQELQKYSLDSNLKFKDAGSGGLQDVLFIAPEPKTFLKVGGVLISGTAKIYLETKAAPLREVTVSVNSVGQVGF